jgi:hypothetical protein
VKSAYASVTQGQMVIRFVVRANGGIPVMSAIEILPAGTATAPSVTTQPASQSIGSIFTRYLDAGRSPLLSRNLHIAFRSVPHEDVNNALCGVAIPELGYAPGLTSSG